MTDSTTETKPKDLTEIIKAIDKEAVVRSAATVTVGEFDFIVPGNLNDIPIIAWGMVDDKIISIRVGYQIGKPSRYANYPGRYVTLLFRRKDAHYLGAVLQA